MDWTCRAHMRKIRHICNILFGKSEGRISLGSVDARNIEMNHKEIGHERVGRIHLLQGRVIRSL